MNRYPRAAISFFLLLPALIFPVHLCPAQTDEILVPEIQGEAPERSVYESLDLFTRVMEIVSEKYVDQIDRQKLIAGALQGMLGSLDDYSQYMEPEIYREMQVETKGEFGGLGIEITLRDGILTVISPIEDTPAIRAGIHPADRIVKIDGETTKNISLFDAVKRLRGLAGTPVSITVMRNGESELLEFTIVRDIIKIESIKDARMLNDDEKIGYIRITQFQEKTVADFDRAMQGLVEEGMKALVIDLRWNPGGLLTSAIAIADRFLKKGQLIVETRGRGDEVEMAARASGRSSGTRIPLAVLINEGSASGSEIVAGALRDNYRAVLVGAKSFGKGSVQTVLPLPDDSGIRLTTGRYFTASHRMIQDKGIEPDVAVEMTTEEKKNFFLKKYRELDQLDAQAAEAPEAPEGEVSDRVSPEEADPADPEPFDPQLRTAVDILKGILIQQVFSAEAEMDS